jgi:cell division transport system ATP-binding protein
MFIEMKGAKTQMIVFDHVTKHYKSNIGLDDVSVKIDQGDFVFLVGPSGAGKSTFIKLILREIDASSGSIFVRGDDITKYSNRMIPKLRRNIGIVFQDFRLLPKKTVYENVAFAMETVHKKGKMIKEQVPQLLQLVGIADKAKKYPDELSAGEQQRVAIARALANNPTILIADEPTGNLDPDTAWEIMMLMEEINRRGTTIVMVTHAKDIVDRMGKRVIGIEKGKIVRDDVGAYNLGELYAGIEMTSDTLQHWREVTIDKRETETND